MPDKSDYNEWDMKVSEWRGYTLKALEDMNKELSSVQIELKGINEKLTGMRLKVAAIGGTTGLIVTIVATFVLGKL
jgi:hypothetical protein